MLPWKISDLPQGNLVYANGTYGVCLDLQEESAPFCVGNGTRDKVNHVSILKVHVIQSDLYITQDFNKNSRALFF